MGVRLEVKEWMSGNIGFGATDYVVGSVLGRGMGTTFSHDVLIQIDDIDRFVSEPSHLAAMDGHVVIDRLGGKLPFTGGTFNMLVDSADPQVSYMFYRIPFADGGGAPHTMLGHKTLRDDPGHDLGHDITTLDIQIFAGLVDGPDMTTPALGPPPVWPSPPIAMGIIHISPADGVRSALSFESPGSSAAAKADAIRKFCTFYGDRVWELYGRTG